ncbi:hypothetical protein HK100_008717 [Physocladia obscura]|uniref:G-protein coupled receptors family 1 profile domain-containing protein n=1 Tax=Physocladia obscura TaxID=109957 RepID=A0AAD5XFF0_9FUNG|nr:hypothetical protein HK100_008717 [Physocladia obscura]
MIIEKQLVFPVLYSVASGIAAMANFVVVASSIGDMDRFSPTTYLAFCMCLTDVINSTSAFITVLEIQFIKEVAANSWICSIDGFFNLYSIANNLTIVFGLTICRYYAIVHSIQISRDPICTIYSLGCGVLTILLGCLPFVLKSSYHLQPSGVYCSIDWTAKSDSTKIVVGITLVVICLPILFILFVYTAIFLKARKTALELKSVLIETDGLLDTERPSTAGGRTSIAGPSSKSRAASIYEPCSARISTRIPGQSKFARLSASAANEEVRPETAVTKSLDEDQNKLLKQSLIIVGLFLMTWSPYFSNF